MFLRRLPRRRHLLVMGLFLFVAVLAAGIWFIGAPPPNAIAGKTVALGPAGSGTDALGRLLFNEFGVTPAKILNLPMKQSRDALERGEAQFAMLVASPHAPAIRDLMARDDIRLIGLPRQAALVRRLPYLR